MFYRKKRAQAVQMELLMENDILVAPPVKPFLFILITVGKIVDSLSQKKGKVQVSLALYSIVIANSMNS